MEDSQQIYSSALINSAVQALIAEKDGHIVWANDALHRMFGYENGELPGQPTRLLFLDQSSYDTYVDEMSAVLSQKEMYSGQHICKHKDGTSRWFKLNISRVKGQLGLSVGSFIDDTDCRALQEELQFHRTIVQDQTEAISRFSPDGTFNFVNDVYCRLFGKSRKDLLGFRWQPVAHPDDLPIVVERLEEMSLANQVVIVENRVKVGTGEWRWFQFVNRGHFDTSGTLREIQSVGRDITELKITEEVLKESETQLDLALMASGLVLWDWNVSAHILTPGRRWPEILGYPNEDLVGRDDLWLKLIHPHDIENYKKSLNHHLRGGGARFESEIRLKHKDGHWVSVSILGKVVSRETDGRPVRMIGTAQDVTQRNRLNEHGLDLLKQIERLIRNNSAKTSESSLALGSLTKRECQILGMISEGMTSAQIAQQLNVATNTVVSHRQKMMSKLGLHSTAEVVRFAMDNVSALPQK